MQVRRKLPLRVQCAVVPFTESAVGFKTCKKGRSVSLIRQDLFVVAWATVLDHIEKMPALHRKFVTIQIVIARNHLDAKNFAANRLRQPIQPLTSLFILLSPTSLRNVAGGQNSVGDAAG